MVERCALRRSWSARGRCQLVRGDSVLRVAVRRAARLLSASYRGTVGEGGARWTRRRSISVGRRSSCENSGSTASRPRYACESLGTARPVGRVPRVVSRLGGRALLLPVARPESARPRSGDAPSLPGRGVAAPGSLDHGGPPVIAPALPSLFGLWLPSRPRPELAPGQDHAALQVGNRLDLDEGARGQLGRLNRGARWRFAARVALVDLVHLREVLHARQEHRGLHQSVETAARRFQDGAEVGEDLFGLLAGGGSGERGLSGLEGDLAGDEDEAIHLDRLRVWRALERRGRLVGADDELLRHQALLSTSDGAITAIPRRALRARRPRRADRAAAAPPSGRRGRGARGPCWARRRSR